MHHYRAYFKKCQATKITVSYPKDIRVQLSDTWTLLGLTLPDFDLEKKREVWLLRTWFGIALVNELVSLTWLLWALRSFCRFTSLESICKKSRMSRKSALKNLYHFIKKQYQRHSEWDCIMHLCAMTIGLITTKIKASQLFNVTVCKSSSGVPLSSYVEMAPYKFHR